MMEQSPQPSEDQPEPHLARRLGQGIFELDNGDFAFTVDTRIQSDEGILDVANQELFKPDEGASVADYETIGILRRKSLIEAKPFIPDEV